MRADDRGGSNATVWRRPSHVFLCFNSGAEVDIAALRIHAKCCRFQERFHERLGVHADIRAWPKSGGAPNTDVELAVALAAIEDASLKNCGGFTIHRGKGGWIDPAGKAIKEEVAILMVSGSYASIEAIAAIGKRMLDHTAIYVKKPDGSTILL
jgi:hypothetical protein